MCLLLLATRGSGSLVSIANQALVYLIETWPQMARSPARYHLESVALVHGTKRYARPDPISPLDLGQSDT